ncbi:hypothetical protein MMC21_008376 [Puttea exsequens]|nr:hypothetical protein [Puttea exsequens]
MFVAAGMAEILSAVPIAGGPYFWAYMLSPPRFAPFFSWITGWFNLLGQVAITAGADFGLANLISTTAQVTNGYNPSPGRTLGMIAVIILSHVVVNALSTQKLRYMVYTAICLNSVFVSALAIAVLAGAKRHNSADFVFAKFFDGTAATPDAEGWSVRASPAYVAVCGVMFSQYTLLGFDACAHLCEETRSAVRVAPRCLLSAVGASFCFGFFLLLCLLFSIQDFDKVRTSPVPILQIFTDSCGHGGGLVLMTIVCLCVWHCGLFSMTSNSRMMFSFARDGGIPHKLHILSPRFRSPLRTVLFAALCAFLLCLPSLGSTTAFFGTTSIATIGLFVSYGIPIAIALAWPRNFKRGPFTLGLWSRPIGVVACMWIAFITLAFCLPTVNPVTAQTLNYTGVAMGIVLVGALGSWFLWARRWFTGRCRNHCRICIAQLDFLAERMVEREENGTPDEPGGFKLHRRESTRPINGAAKNIAVNQDIEIMVAPSDPQPRPQTPSQEDTYHEFLFTNTNRSRSYGRIS